MKRWVVVAMLAAGVARADAPGPAFGGPYAYAEAGGAAIYANVCAACHMPAGQGAVGAGAYPALAHNAHLVAAAYPIAVVLRGQKAMPSFGRSLSDEQIAAVVGYIRTHFGNDDAGDPTAADVAAVRAAR